MGTMISLQLLDCAGLKTITRSIPSTFYQLMTRLSCIGTVLHLCHSGWPQLVEFGFRDCTGQVSPTRQAAERHLVLEHSAASRIQ
jgi:hypothetical protein